MSSFWNFLFGAILVILWIISGGFITQANVFLDPYMNKDNNLHDAYWYTFWGAFVTWTLIGIFIIIIILSVIGVVALFGSGIGEVGVAAEEGAVVEEGALSRAGNIYRSPQGQNVISTGVSWFTIAFLIFALILVATTGILAALAASSISKSSNFKPDMSKFNTAYTDCIIAASLCLGAGGLLILGIIIYFIIGEERQRIINAQKKKIQEERTLELEQLNQLKIQARREKLAEQATFRQQLQQAQENALIQKVYQQAGVTRQ